MSYLPRIPGVPERDVQDAAKAFLEIADDISRDLKFVDDLMYEMSANRFDNRLFDETINEVINILDRREGWRDIDRNIEPFIIELAARVAYDHQPDLERVYGPRETDMILNLMEGSNSRNRRGFSQRDHRPSRFNPNPYGSREPSRPMGRSTWGRQDVRDVRDRRDVRSGYGQSGYSSNRSFGHRPLGDDLNENPVRLRQREPGQNRRQSESRGQVDRRGSVNFVDKPVEPKPDVRDTVRNRPAGWPLVQRMEDVINNDIPSPDEYDRKANVPAHYRDTVVSFENNKPLMKEKPMNEIPVKPREQKRLSDGRPYVNVVHDDGSLHPVTPRLHPLLDKTNSISIKPITTPGNVICEYVDENEEPTGRFIRVAIRDLYMNREEHETVRFFDVYDKYADDNVAEKQTAKLIDALQVKRSVETLERELKEKYDIKKPEDLIEVLDGVTVDLGEHVGPSSSNISVLDSRFVVGESIGEDSQLANVDPIKMNVMYDNINVVNWAVDGPAKNKLLSLKDQTSFQGIKRVILELRELLSTDLVADINKIATNWMNSYLHRRHGQTPNTIDSFIGDLDELESILYEHICSVGEQEWKDAAKLMLRTALNVVEVNDEIHEQLQQHHEKGHVTIINCTRVIRVNKTADEIEIPRDPQETLGCIGAMQNVLLKWAFDSVVEDLKEDTLETVLITADGQKMFIQGICKDNHDIEYVISKH